MRVAVAQFATSFDTAENLTTCLRMIDEVAACNPGIVVLPEFCNTQPCYSDHNQVWQQALAIESDFLHQIAQQAKKYACYIVLNVTLRRDLNRDQQDASVQSNISITSCLFSPSGELVQQVDKQKLTEQERQFFISEKQAASVISSDFGKFGLMSGADSYTFQASRALAINGAQLICNSEHSFALDTSTLHDITHAVENNVFIASANKVGALRPKKSADALAETTETLLSISNTSVTEQAYGVGQSQIIAPDGKLLAKIEHNKAGYTFADIEMLPAGLINKARPDGTEFKQQQRPEFKIEKITAKQPTITDHEYSDNVPETINVAIFATYKSTQQAIEDVCHYIENNLSDIIQLPELFFIADKTVTDNQDELKHIECLSHELIQQISAVLRPFQYVCTSVVLNGNHQAVLINQQGIVARQQQLHFCQRYQWTELTDTINIISLPLEQGIIKLAMLTADDANIAETVNIAALHNIHLLLMPFDIQEPLEVNYSLLARAAENRICIVAATREKSFYIQQSIDEKSLSTKQNNKKVKSQKSTGFIANLSNNSALLAQWQSGKFNGYINKPIIKHQHGKITKALIYPNASTDKNSIEFN
tara:strand:- start:144698 stop:146482 length:1785 start_codon:yes stop_codon:yes gene_type:complete